MTIKRREKISIIIGFCILIVALGWLYIIQPYFFQLSEVSDRIAIRRNKLARGITLINQLKKFQNRDTQLNLQITDAKKRFYLPSDVSKFLPLLEQKARNAHIEVVRITPIGYKEVANDKSYEIQMDTSSDMATLLKFIYLLKDNTETINLFRLNIQSNVWAAQQRGKLSTQLLISIPIEGAVSQ